MKVAPFSVDPKEYPFKSHWFERNGVSMHYVDEGEGLPVVMCHGNPTWSYLYRNVIKPLRGQYRCIAYDLPGFGYSDHPANYGYTPQEQASWVEALIIEHLQLEHFILVMQDWGGPTGLRLATRYPQRIDGLVISSTWAWPASTIASAFSRFFGSKLGQYLILQHNFFAKNLISMMLGKVATPTLKAAYTAPFPTPESRLGTAIFPAQIRAAEDWLAQIERDLVKLADKPVEFVFGLKDVLSREADIDRWLGHFPHAGIQKVSDAGHYTQEHCPECFVAAVHRIVDKSLHAMPT